jgi:hypothetical protein
VLRARDTHRATAPETTLTLPLPRCATPAAAATQALVLLAQPRNSPAALRLLAELLDTIWYAAGDTATDSSWYSKRAALALVYSTTELYMLTDYSPGVLCCVVLCCVVLCCVVLCCVVLCCVVLCCVVLCCVVFVFVLMCCVVLCRVVSSV